MAKPDFPKKNLFGQIRLEFDGWVEGNSIYPILLYDNIRDPGGPENSDEIENIVLSYHIR